LKEEFEECKKSLKNANCEIKELKHCHHEKIDILLTQNIKLKDEEIRDKISYFLWHTFPP